MPSPPSTRPSDARGRRSSAFVRERYERRSAMLAKAHASRRKGAGDGLRSRPPGSERERMVQRDPRPLRLGSDVVAGLLWDHVSHAAVFLYGAAFAIAGSIALMALVPAMQIRRPT